MCNLFENTGDLVSIRNKKTVSKHVRFLFDIYKCVVFFEYRIVVHTK